MTEVFADTSYYISLLIESDAGHQLASTITRTGRNPVVTTTGVLAELGNYFANPRGRRQFVSLVEDLRADPDVTIVDLEFSLFDRAFSLYSGRPDKEWSFVDCASFIVMRERSITSALTTDHHFTQAGFTALLR